MKRRDDTLDQQAASAFRWGGMGASIDVTPLPSSEADARKRAKAAAPAMHAAVVRVAKLPPSSQPQALLAILERLEGDAHLELEVGGAEMTATRLVTLVARHLHHLPPERRDSLLGVLNWVVLGGPELGNMLVEVARAGDGGLAFVVEMALGEGHAWKHVTDVVPALGDVVARAPLWSSRRIAVRFLSHIGTRAALARLRPALRAPNLYLRHVALAMLHARDEALTEEDLLFLLEDAVAHPFESHGTVHVLEAGERVPTLLLEALRIRRPRAAIAPLTQIVEGEGATLRGDRYGVDAGWALEGLAILDPEAAKPRIEKALGSLQPYRAALAACELDEATARALLADTLLTTDVHLADAVRKRFVERFGRELDYLPSDSLDVLLVPLSHPPSDAFKARLSVVRRGTREAKEALLTELVAEAHAEPASERAREELLALFGVLCAYSRSWAIYNAGSPTGPWQWPTWLLDRFGEAAEPVLAALARLSTRHPDHEWGHVFGEVLDRLTERGRASLRAELARGVFGPRACPSSTFLSSLAKLGAPPETKARLWALTIEREGARPEDHRGSERVARAALASLPEDAALDAALITTAREALATGDLWRTWRALDVARERAVKASAPLAREILAYAEAWPVDEATRALLSLAVKTVASAEDRSAEEVLAGLSDPASRRFVVWVEGLPHDWAEEREAVLEAIERGMGTSVRGGESACVAAAKLLWMDVVSIDDPRLQHIVASSALEHAAPLSYSMAIFHHSLRQPIPHDEACRVALRAACGPSARDAENAVGRLTTSASLLPLLRDAYEAGKIHPAARYLVERACEIPTEAEQYWRDRDEPRYR